MRCTSFNHSIIRALHIQPSCLGEFLLSIFAASNASSLQLKASRQQEPLRPLRQQPILISVPSPPLPLVIATLTEEDAAAIIIMASVVTVAKDVAVKAWLRRRAGLAGQMMRATAMDTLAVSTPGVYTPSMGTAPD
eukprot:TRINITY_DN4496_c1_g1_i1.p1 TRINITY_DN4496_c1_g1~~TRINITY_DN4496_c1_g1_i1.p1  ORF type:complete len:136 (+),score=18.90 TRINITY_DN4496_c1_g1_i1:27-434(+)